MSYRSITEIKVFETPWSGLPEELTVCFSAQERLAYQEGAPFFKNCAKRSGERVLIKLLDSLDEDQPMRVYVERLGTDPPDIWFGFAYLSLEQQPQFKLADKKPDSPWIPPRLERIFGAFSGIRGGEHDEGGLRSPRLMTEEELQPFADSLLSLDSECYIEFFSFGNGDVVAWDDDGSAVLFDHETNEVYTRDLNEFIDGYFSDLARDFLTAMREQSKHRKK